MSLQYFCTVCVSK